MKQADFIKLNGLISKLNHAVNHASREDDCFRKYFQHSVNALKEAEQHLKKVENGLKAARYLSS